MHGPALPLWMQRWLGGWSGVVVGQLASLLVLATIWLPELTHFAVMVPAPHTAAVQAMRSEPSDALLDELAAQSLGGQPTLSEAELLLSANRLVTGWYEPRSLPSVRTGPGFNVAAIEAPSPTTALLVAGLAPVDVLVRAYRIRGNPNYLQTAELFLLGFAEYERRMWVARGLLWNDHAIASRINVLIGFWRVWRQAGRPTAGVELAVMSLITRGAAQLAKPGLFTAATNHGVMQNIALMQAALAFPQLPGRDRWLSIAQERLDLQLPFYLGPEGIVLEHSAGYHQHGLTLVAMVLRLEHLAGLPVRQHLLRLYEEGVNVLRLWRRPDSTLPSFGNTSSRGESFHGLLKAKPDLPLQAIPEEKPASSFGLFPISGYATTWSGLEYWPNTMSMSQTNVVWSNFAGHGHKHADEMSLQIWADGKEWISNVGYWPYGTPGYAQAISWPGSNAPHAIGEERTGLRQTRLLGYGYGPASGGSFLDLERSSSAGGVFRRQILALKEGLWLILDTSGTDPGGRETRRLWTAGAGLDWLPHGGGFTTAAGEKNLRLVFAGSPAPRSSLLKASPDPFAGWLVIDGRASPASSVALEQPAGGWLMTVLAMEPDSSRSPASVQVDFEAPDRWSARLNDSPNAHTIRRAGEHIEMDGHVVLQVGQGAQTAQSRELLAGSFRRAIEQYPRSRDLLRYRQRLTTPVILAAALQEVLVFGVALRWSRAAVWLRALSLLGWIAVAAWLRFAYLV